MTFYSFRDDHLKDDSETDSCEEDLAMDAANQDTCDGLAGTNNEVQL